MGRHSQISVKTLIKTAINAYYRLLSPWLGNRCRYVPSCSEYANQAIDAHGSLKGLVLTTKRLCRCHPLGGHGYDPIPAPKKARTDEPTLLS